VLLANSNKMDPTNNSWNEDTDSEYDDEYTENEIPPPAINQEFIDNILEVKHKLYETTVLAPKLETPEAQSNEVLQKYMNNLNSVYVMAINAQTGKIIGNEQKINNLPPETREMITRMLNLIADYFSKNKVPDTIPYSDFIENSLRIYPFVQDNSFE
jgi:hypothetical protein